MFITHTQHPITEHSVNDVNDVISSKQQCKHFVTTIGLLF